MYFLLGYLIHNVLFGLLLLSQSSRVFQFFFCIYIFSYESGNGDFFRKWNFLYETRLGDYMCFFYPSDFRYSYV